MNHSRMRIRLVVAAILCVTGALPVGAGAYEEGAAAYEQGDYQRALDLWFPLALAGHCRAQFGLGEVAALHLRYEPTVSVELDSATAAKLNHRESAAEYWLVEAAEQGHAGAMRELAELYSLRLTHYFIFPDALVKRDFWYRRAAKSGDLWSMRMLIEKYFHTDPFESLKWAFLLKDGGDPRGDADGAITDLSRRLTDDEVLDARRFARNWRPDHHPPTRGGLCE